MVREGYSECKACRDEYISMNWNKGYCAECHMEIFEEDISLSILSIFESNEEIARKKRISFNSRSEGQRVGIGKTTS